MNTIKNINKSAFVNDTIRDISTKQLVKDMGLGINLGNTLECCGDWIDSSNVTNYETAWGSPVITYDTIRGYSLAGFKTLRVPVAWSNMMQQDYTIHKDYMARVNTIVDWALSCGMYVILNLHWDGGWINDFPTNKQQCMYKYNRIWSQICNRFKDYNDYLMFEALNEEGCWNSLWNRYDNTNSDPQGKQKAYALLNEINQTFVDIVRASNGNNPKRHLLISGYATDIKLTCNELFKMPNDIESRCALSVHYYTPDAFCLLDKDTEWCKATDVWGSQQDYSQLERYVQLLKTNFIDKKVPIILGEFGVVAKNKSKDSIKEYLSAVCKQTTSLGICPVVWDINNLYYDRTLCTATDTSIIQSMLNSTV